MCPGFSERVSCVTSFSLLKPCGIIVEEGPKNDSHSFGSSYLVHGKGGSSGGLGD